MTLFKQLAGETLVYGVSHVLGKVLNYVLIAFYLTRKLAGLQSEYAIYNELYFYVAILIIILGLRMETTFFRFGSDVEDYKKAFSNGLATMMSTGLLWFIPAFIFSDQIAAFLSYPDKGIYIRILSALVAIDLIIAMPLARYRLDQRPVRFALLQTGSIILNIALVLFFLEICPYMGWTLWRAEDILMYVFIGNLIARVILLIVLLPNVVRLGWHFDAGIWRKMIWYAWPLVLVGLAGVINQSSYIFLQKYFLSDDILQNLTTGGIYAAAAKIALLMNLFVIAYNFAAEPFFFKQARRKDATYIYAQMAQAFSWIAALIMLVLLLFLDLFEYIVDATYRDTMYVVPIILVGYYFLGLYYNLAIWYKVTNKTIYGALISTIGTAVTIIVNLWLLPHIGVVASAYAALCCYFVMSLLCFAIGRNHLRVPYAMWKIFSGLFLVIFIYVGFNAVAPELSKWISWIVRFGLLGLFFMVFWITERKKVVEWLQYK